MTDDREPGRPGIMAMAAMVAAIAVLLAGPVTALAQHEPSHDQACTDPAHAGAFVCGYVSIVIEPDADIDAIFDACPPPPLRVVGPMPTDQNDPDGRQFADLEVEIGTEVGHRDCYAEQPGVSDAVLGGLGELTPDTAVPMPQRASPAFLALLLVLMVATGAARLAPR